MEQTKQDILKREITELNTKIEYHQQKLKEYNMLKEIYEKELQKVK